MFWYLERDFISNYDSVRGVRRTFWILKLARGPTPQPFIIYIFIYPNIENKYQTLCVGEGNNRPSSNKNL